MISLPLSPKITKKEKNKAVFEIDALYPGYGVTIGNSLRRVLLSSMPGAAVTQMKIKGAAHEFSTISGILEDVMNIMLNLKQLRFKVFSEDPQVAHLKVKGEKEVKGSDFDLPSQLELINKDCHICTLTSKSAEIDLEIQVEKGIGFLARENRKKEKSEIGAIPLDAIFTPVKMVKVKVENMRVGDRTDFDKLSLEVETDGIMTPEEAFSKSSEILVNHFSLFIESVKPKEEPEVSEEQGTKKKAKETKTKDKGKKPEKKSKSKKK